MRGHVRAVVEIAGVARDLERIAIGVVVVQHTSVTSTATDGLKSTIPGGANTSCCASETAANLNLTMPMGRTYRHRVTFGPDVYAVELHPDGPERRAPESLIKWDWGQLGGTR